MTVTTHQVEIPEALEARFQKRIDELLEDYPECPRAWLHQQLFREYVARDIAPEFVTIAETD